MRYAAIAIILIAVFTGVAGATEITDCQKVNASGYYNLTNDINNYTNYGGSMAQAWACIPLDDTDSNGGINVTIDCMGHSIIGNGTYGGENEGRAFTIPGWWNSNYTIVNCNVTNVTYGIRLAAGYPITGYGGNSTINVTNSRFIGVKYVLYEVSDPLDSVLLFSNNLFNVTGHAYVLRGGDWNIYMSSVGGYNGTRIFSNGTWIGNYYTNQSGNGFSDKCPDSDRSGLCDTIHVEEGDAYIHDSLAMCSIDGVAPSVYLEQPSNRTQTTDYPLFYFQYTDARAGTCVLKSGSVDGLTNYTQSADVSGNTTKVFPTESYLAKEYSWKVKCTDVSGNTFTTDAFNLTITGVGGGGGGGGGGSSGGTYINFLAINISAGEINNFMFYPVSRDWRFVITSQRELTECQCHNFTCSVTKTQLRLFLNASTVMDNEAYVRVQDTCVTKDLSGSWATVPTQLHIINVGAYYPVNTTLPFRSDLVFAEEDGVQKGIRYGAILFLFGVIYVGYKRGI